MYDAFASDYDRFVSWPGRLQFELPFLQKQLESLKVGRPLRMLDAACGTGMHAIALAQRGFQAAGADLSAAMIAKAQENAHAAGVNVPFRQAGFGELQQAFGLQNEAVPSFNAVFCLGNSLPHVLSLPDLQAALADFAGCLAPGGMLIVQNRNFNAVVEKQDRWMEPQAHREGPAEWLFVRFYDFEAGGLIRFNILTLKRSEGSAWQQSLSSTLLRPLLQAELAAGLSAAGFARVEWYGSLAGEPFDPEKSGNLIAVGYQ